MAHDHEHEHEHDHDREDGEHEGPEHEGPEHEVSERGGSEHESSGHEGHEGHEPERHEPEGHGREGHEREGHEPQGPTDEGHHHGDHDHDGHDHDAQAQLDEAERAEIVEREARKRVALAQIRQYGDPALRMRANEVEEFDEEVRRVAERMVALMHDADGIGLAATQVGILRRMFVFNDDGEDRVLVNPVITKRGSTLETDDEGCLSLGPVRVPVERNVEVTVEGKDETGAPVKLELEGYPARVVQHEIDHLDGTLMIDRTDDESRRRALSALRPRLVVTR